MEKLKMGKGLKRLLISAAVVFGLHLIALIVFTALIANAGDTSFSNFGEVIAYYGKGILDLFAFNYANTSNFLYFALSVFLYAFIIIWAVLIVIGIYVNDKKNTHIMRWGIGLTFVSLLVYLMFATASQKLWAITNARGVYADQPALMFLSILLMVLGTAYFVLALGVYFWGVFHIYVNSPAEPEEDPDSDLRQAIKEELQACQPFRVEIINQQAPVVIEKEVKPEPTVEPEPEPVVEEEEEDENNPNRKRVPFMKRILEADAETKANYNELKNEILSYGVKSRVSNSGDTFRLKRKAYVKIGIGGKSLKAYFALNPEDYKDSPMPIKDVGHKAVYGETPLLLKVRSPLSVRRAKQLIADVMEKDAIPQGDIGEENYVSEFRSINAGKANK